MREAELRIRQSTGVASVMDTLKTIELNIMNNCNRTCSFCPHSDMNYGFKQGHMSMETIDKIVSRMLDINYNNRVSVCGFGEPTLYKNVNQIINKLDNTNAFIELITNGDLLDIDRVNSYYDNGLDLLNVSVYDSESDEVISNLLAPLPESKYIIRRRYLDNSNLVNRIDIIRNVNNGNNNPCYVPSYKMIIDTNGDVLLCNNDWTRKEKFGNIHTDSLTTIWLTNMHNRRMELINGKRINNACLTCDIRGTLYGSEIANYFKEYEELTEDN